MSQTQAPLAPFTWTPIETGVPGLVGTIAVGIYQGDTPIVALSTVGITETESTGIYEAELVAPAVGGDDYLLIASLDGSLDVDQVISEQLIVTTSSISPILPSGFDLCTLEDVVGYAPGYDPLDPDNAAENAKLQTLLTGQSQLIPSQTGREIIPLEPVQPATRTFDIDQERVHDRDVPIGDMATTAGLVVRLLSGANVVLATIDNAAIDALYDGKRNAENSWEPITSLSFPRLRPGAPIFYCGYVLEVTARYGFAQIPGFIRDATAARTIIRYLSDVAASGTPFSEAAKDLNFGAMFASSQEAIDQLSGGGVLIG